MLQERPDVTRGADPGPQELIARRGPHDLPAQRRRGLHRPRDARGRCRRTPSSPRTWSPPSRRCAASRGPDHDGPAVPARASRRCSTQEALETRDGVTPVRRSTSRSPTRRSARAATAPTTRCARWCAWRPRWSRCSPRSRMQRNRQIMIGDPHHRGRGGRARGGHAPRGGAAHPRAGAGGAADRRGRLRGARARRLAATRSASSAPRSTT